MRVISVVADFSCVLHNLAEKLSWARDTNYRDVDNFCRDETEAATLACKQGVGQMTANSTVHKLTESFISALH